MTRKHQQSGDDPVDGIEGVRPISDSVARLARQLGLGDAQGLSAVFGRWDQVVGPVLAAHTRPDRLRDGELIVLVDEASWATEVRFMADTIATKCNEHAGRPMVQQVVVRVVAFPSDRGGDRSADHGAHHEPHRGAEKPAKKAWNVGQKPRSNPPE
jgi:predicted nucleic acid-binding Zn ribbon protein